MTNWNKRFMELATFVSKWSKDKSTGTGAIICDDDKRIISIGYNGFPSGCNDEIESRHERPAKYQYTEHAERNSIYNAARIGAKTKDATIYVMWFPCTDCARAIIQSGIKKLVCKRPDFYDERWGQSFIAANEMLIECKIEIEFVEDEIKNDSPL